METTQKPHPIPGFTCLLIIVAALLLSGVRWTLLLRRAGPGDSLLLGSWVPVGDQVSVALTVAQADFILHGLRLQQRKGN